MNLSLWPSAMWRHWNVSSFVQAVKDYNLVHIKQLLEPIMTYHQLDTEKQTSLKLKSI